MVRMAINLPGVMAVAAFSWIQLVPSVHAQAAADPHAAHRAVMEPAVAHGVQRSVADYVVPAEKLIRDDGKMVDLRNELDDGRPVYLNFIYTTCTTICPLSSQVFSQLQRKLGAEAKRVHLASVSIDPEQDTQSRLASYAKRFNAAPGWSHYTGTIEASIAVQQAFGAYRGDKMNHTPLTLFRAAPGQPWVRLDGFADAGVLLAEYQDSASPGGP